MIAEMQRSPETFFDFAPYKIGRYCFPLRWPQIENSANDALRQFLELVMQDIMKPSAYATDLAYQKALAKFNVRCGKAPDSKLLWMAVSEGWHTFIKELQECNEDTGRIIKEGGVPWAMFVCVFWARPSFSPRPEWWPLCFWSDKALVSFLRHSKEFMGVDWSDCTLDKWRKFKRKYKLQRPDHLVVRDFERAVDYEGKLLGFELRYKPIQSDKRGCAFQPEGGKQSTI